MIFNESESALPNIKIISVHAAILASNIEYNEENNYRAENDASPNIPP